MNKIGITLLLLLLTFGSYNFAEETFDNKSQVKDLTFNACLTVSDIDDDGFVLVLNDGSEWNIKYFGGVWKLLGWGWTEQYEVSHWTKGDTIEIQYPGSGNFTDFILVINNLSKNEKALANLKQAPSVDCPACLWIADFDKDTQRVTLNDGTIWSKTTTDMYGAFFQQCPSSQDAWKIGDALTLIKGEGWLNANSFLLWNHSINEMPYVNKLEPVQNLRMQN